MVKSTYGMAGVGIAAAIGFVFALSLFVSYANDDAGSNLLEQQQEQARTQPSSSLFVQQRAGDSADADNGSSQEMTARTMDSAEKNETAFEGQGGENASSMMQQSEEASPSSLRPTLVSIIAFDGGTGEIIGEVVPDMQFEVGKPVFIKARLANPNSVQIPDNIIALGISSNSDSVNEDESRTGSELKSEDSNRTLTQRLPYEQASSFHGDIGAGENIELELYWNPVQPGEYRLLLFSIAPNELNSIATTETVAPIMSVNVKVKEPTG